MLHPELFKSLEAARRRIADDKAWSSFDRSELADQSAIGIEMNAITEWPALPVTEMLVRDTLQSRRPGPALLESGLSQQVRFDKDCEVRVIVGLLRDRSALCRPRRRFAADLNRCRKTLAGA